MRERTIFALVVLSLFLIVIGYLVATNLDLGWMMPVPASTRSVLVDQLFRFMLGIATVIFLVVEGALIYAVLRFRRKPGDDTDAAPIHGNNTLEVVWTLIPAVIVAVISIYSYQVLTQVEAPGDDPLVVEVIGRQFVWEFHYPEAGISSQELHLPVDRTVFFQITSEDVIHSFWVPEFRVKRDATPGQISELVVTPTRPGRYPIRCAELCGPGHAAMVGEVVVEDEAAFTAWVAEQSGEPAAISQEPGGDSSDALDGRALFIQYGCGACHTLADAGGASVVGPTLEGIPEVVEGRHPDVSVEDYLLQSILNPNAYIVEGFQAGLMPANFSERMSDAELQTLVDYLLHQ